MAKMPVRPYYQSHSARADQRGGDKAPPVAHLAVRMNASSIAPIEPGVHMYIVRDPKRVDGVFELVFEKVKFKQGVPIELHFKVPSDKPNSTRKCIMTIAWLGLYSSWLEDENRRVAEAQLAARSKPNPECTQCRGLGEPDVEHDGVHGVTPCNKCWGDDNAQAPDAE